MMGVKKPTPMPAAGKPKDPLEDVHFRLDELHRMLAAQPSTDHIAGIAAGVTAAALERIEAQLVAMKTATDEDVRTDREIIQSVRDLIEQLKKPVTRTTTVNLPSGPVTMTTTEKR
jgi:hypothetical protein